MVKVENYNLPDELYYWAKGYTWAKIEANNRVKVGITDFGQDQAGKDLHIRIRPKGHSVVQGKFFGTLESAKWVGPLESPVSGVIVDVNEEIKKPENRDLVKEDPYGRGWLAEIQPSHLEEELKNLLRGEAAVKWLTEEIAKAKKQST